MLLPDARVFTANGTAAPGINPSSTVNRDIEAFSPPYLFRGLRPRIDALSTPDLMRGGSVDIDVSFTFTATSVTLVGLNAVTHWVDGGVQRLIELPFTQSGGRIRATAPTSPGVAMAGYYMLFVMVDDIPSIARIVRIQPS